MPFKKMRVALSVVAGLAAVSMLQACSGVGDGNGLKSVRIVPSSTTDTTTPVEAFTIYTCVRDRLTLLGEFDDGGLGDYSSNERDTRWSTSSPGVVRVSNGDEPIPGAEGTFFPAGTLIPVEPGTATISATYLGLSDQITVTVGTSTDFAITPASTRIVPRSLQTYKVTAMQGGVVREITSNTTLALPDDSEEIAVFTPGVGVTAVAVGGPLELKATFPSVCTQELSATVTVATPTALTLTHEPGFSGDKVVVGTTEAYKLFAEFGAGPEQDLTTQAVFSATNPDSASPLMSFDSANLLNSIKAGGAVPIQAVFGRVDLNGDGDVLDEGENAGLSNTNAISVTPVAATLASFTIDPPTASIGTRTSQQFTALGVYDGGAFTQPITRHVQWASSDTQVAAILTTATGGAVNPLAGLASSLQTIAGSATITATSSITNTSQTATLTVEP